MTVKYHVFLPPTISAHSKEGTTAEPLTLLLLARPPRDDSLQSASQNQPICSVLESPAFLRPVRSLRTSGQQGEGSSSRPSKRKSLSVGPHASAAGTQSQFQPSGSGSNDSTRRRSARITGKTMPISSALPRLDETESFLSLNTTNSAPSQLPLTALGNQSLYYLPKWSIPLQRLSSLSTLMAEDSRRRKGKHVEKQTVDIIVCVMAVEAPVMRARKEEKARGKEGTLWVGNWKITAPPDGQGEAGSCGVKLWETCARDWGTDRIRRGDVVLLNNAEWRPSTSREPAHLVLSPFPAGGGPSMTILYRTLPRTSSTATDYAYQPKRPMLSKPPPLLREDKALRPDLRLGRSDPGVRKVEEYATWFADWVGGVPPP